MSGMDHHTPSVPGGQLNERELLESALRELLIEKGIFSAEDVEAQLKDMDGRTPKQGARLVARYWSDPGFRDRANADLKAAAQELGIDTYVAPDLVILENTPQLHHVVVCTLCSCYPRAINGPPPSWYKSHDYRARAVSDTRAVLAEFDTVLPDDVEIRVVDASADCRYLVVPLRPDGTEGMSEEELAELVTEESMIGVAQALKP